MTPQEMAKLYSAALTIGRPWSTAEIAEFLGDPHGFAVARDTGFALGRVIADEAELLALAVDPGARRRGHGAALLKAFEREAGARGATNAFLEVAETNDAARALYGAAGYAEAGRRRAYYRAVDGTPVDGLVLQKPLAAQ